MSADGHLDWTPPPGRWRIVRLGYSLLGTGNHPAEADATGLEIDKYDPAVVRRYMETYLGLYSDAVGPTIHAPLSAGQTDPWAPKVSETQNAFYGAVDQDRFVRAIA